MFSVVIAVGPGQNERDRTLDLISQFTRHEKASLAEFLIIDDTNKAGIWDDAKSHFNFVSVLKSPRAGQGDPWRGGLAVNVLGGINTAFRNHKISFVLKLDTDSFILRPFSHEIHGIFEADTSLGMIGSCFETNLVGKAMDPYQFVLKQHLKLFRLRRRPLPHLQSGFWGKHKEIRDYIKLALNNGWHLGSHAQGGGYAVSSRVFDRWQQKKFYRNPMLWLNTQLGEDVVISLLTYAAGLRIADYNKPNQPFGVAYEGLGFPPAELKRRNYAIIHSVKSKSWEEEQEIRRALSQ